MINNIKS